MRIGMGICMRILAASVLTLSTVISAEAKVDRPPQFVMLAFDGSRNLDFWKQSRKFARETGVRFTYFISGVYFLAQKDRKDYREPQRGRGRSAIGFGGKPADVGERVEQVALAVSEGHEIASHANAHFNGAKYSKSQWQLELNQFESIMANSWSRYSKLKEPVWWRDYFTKEMKGLRAPELGRGPGLFKALKAKGYSYDTSRTAKLDYWPEKLNGVWNFPLAHVRMAGSRRGTLSMDYNFYVADSRAKRGPVSRFKRYENRMFDTYMNYFNYNYSGPGNRAPIDIGHHFSAWNGAAYWRAMKRFTREVCGKPEVICGTYSELLKFVEENSDKLNDFRRGNFDRKSEPSSLMMAYATPPKITRTYERVVPAVAVASLPEEKKPEKKAVVVAKLDPKPKVRRTVFDAGLRRPDLAKMTPAEVKAYWTLVWYARRGQKIPDDEARALGIPVESKPSGKPVVKKRKKQTVVAKAEPKPKAKPVTTSKPIVAAKPEKPARPKAKVAVASSTKQKPAAESVAKLTEPKTKSKAVVVAQPEPAKPEVKRSVEQSSAKPKVRKPRVIFDAGLRRPNLAAMNAAERKAYWTKVWFARRAQRAKKRRGS